MKNRIKISRQIKFGSYTRYFFIGISCIWIYSGCTVAKQLQLQGNKILFQDTVIKTGHWGVSIFEPATNTYWYDYNGDKYFVPGSNVKLFALYAGMKYLGDSLVGARYAIADKGLFIQPTGDPTFLHPDFKKQPLLELIQSQVDRVLLAPPVSIEPYGAGWAWDDYDQGYTPEKSSFPMFGNKVWLRSEQAEQNKPSGNPSLDTLKYFEKQGLHVYPKFFAEKIASAEMPVYKREKNENAFYVDSVADIESIPFLTNGGNTQVEILENILNRKLSVEESFEYAYMDLKSQPTDSLLKPMMHNSDNFFAEQTLLMASNSHLGYMGTEAIIDTLLKSELKDVPQLPAWVDGSGLSRYNLFTPRSFIYILTKMKDEFGLERLKEILPTGGEGTLENYFTNDSTFIYAKTGTLKATIALSGFLITRKNKLLVFSFIANNFKGKATAVRRAFEKFITGIRMNY
jgi:D-alanyl-D-alanine carboxypeptidase/D-alanyl-D-alanine-endopeptidase (penicillin-binding protein 4)